MIDGMTTSEAAASEAVVSAVVVSAASEAVASEAVAVAAAGNKNNRCHTAQKGTICSAIQIKTFSNYDKKDF